MSTYRVLPPRYRGIQREPSPIVFNRLSARALHCELYINPPRYDQVASFSNLMTSRPKKAPGGPGFKEIGYEKYFMRQYAPTKPSPKPTAPPTRKGQQPQELETGLEPLGRQKSEVVTKAVPHVCGPPSYYENYVPKPPRYHVQNDELLQLLKVEEERARQAMKRKEGETFAEFHARMNTRADGTMVDARSFNARFGIIKDPVTPPCFSPLPWVTLTKEEREKVEQDKRTGNALHAYNLKKRLEEAMKTRPLVIAKRPKPLKVEVLFTAKKKASKQQPTEVVKPNQKHILKTLPQGNLK